MRKKVIFSLYKKEMLDILRDKKTILMMIVIPLILYPLIFAGSMFLASSMLKASTSKSYMIGFENLADEQAMVDAFNRFKDEHDYSFIYYRPESGIDDEEEQLKQGNIDAYLIESVSDNKPYYEIAYLASETDSQTASGMIKDILQDIQKDATKEKIKELGLEPEAVLKPIDYTYRDLSSKEENAGYVVGMIVPFLLITSILMGALYPAIDATAGEKERGTLETLLTLPVKNLELIVAKFMATSTVAVGAAFLNLISMALMGFYMVSAGNMGSSSGIDLASFIPALIVTLLCVFTFAMFASAVCLSACIFARSFKEAQNFTTPVMLVFMVGGMAGMLPQLSLDPVTAMIPVVNIAMLIIEIFKFHFELSQIAVVLLSNLAYTAVAVVIMGRLFSSENILFGDATVSLRLLENRSHMKEKQIPGMGDLVLVFAALIIIVLFGGGLLVLRFGLWGLVAEQLLIFAVTAAYAWYIKTDMKVVFHLHRPRITAMIAGILAWAGMYLLVQLLANLVVGLFPDLSQENAQVLTSLWEDSPMWLMVLSSALMPAVCEEFAFRGFMLGSFEFKFKPAVAVILTGLFFAAFHMSLLQFITIAPLGILLSYIVWKERSIFITMLLHFLNNLTSLLLEQYQEELTKKLPFLEGELDVTGVLIFLFAGVVLLGAGLLLMHAKKKESVAA